MPSLCCRSKHSATEFASAAAQNNYAPNTVLAPTHLDICLWFGDLRDETVKAKVTVTVSYQGTALVSDTNDRSVLRLNAEGFNNVVVTGEQVSHAYDGHIIQLVWATPFDVGMKRDVVIEYTLDHPQAGLYFQAQGSIIGANPRWAVTDHESERARYWLPTIDYPIVRTTLSWSITAPSEYTSLANGSFVSQSEHDGYRTTSWRLDYPCPSYLVCFAVGELLEIEDESVNDMPIKYYAAKGYNPADVNRAFDKTPAMVRWLQDKVGKKFPWPKYYQIALPPMRGAMENISLVTWVDTVITDEINALERKLLIDLVNIHEMAHTYFGDLLVIQHFEHAWLKESWATYIESCWLEDNCTVEEFQYEMYLNSKSYFSECALYTRPIVTRRYDASWDMFDMHTYPGGAWRIHMLRKILGDDAFWAATRDYINTYATKTVETTDFKKCLEKASGLNLTRFFDEWLYSPGYPRLSGEYAYDLASNTVTIMLSQTQANNDHQPLFQLNLDIKLTDNHGNSYLRTVHFDREAKVVTCISLKEGTSPHVLQIDPETKVLYSLDMPADQTVLENTAKESDSIFNRLWAYNELVKLGTRSALKDVQKLIYDEKFYGVRVQVAKMLATLKTQFSLEILAGLLDREEDPKALAPILTACQINDGIIEASVRRFLSSCSPIPYRAHAAALIALACQHKDSDLKYLLDIAKDNNALGQHGLVRGGVLKALGYHRSEEAFLYLLDRLASNAEPLRAKVQAIHGLQYGAEWQTERVTKRAIEVLIKLSRDPEVTVRTAAVDALVSLRATSSLSELESSRSLYANDLQASFDRKLQKIRESGSGQGTGCSPTREEVERLEARIKALEKKIQEADKAESDRK